MKILARTLICAAACLLAACDNPSDSGAPGQEILFVRRAGETGGIFAMHPDGSGEVQLTHNSEDACPRWSPNGRNIAFTRARLLEPGLRARELFLMRADGTGIRQISSDRISCADGAPDGRRLVYDAPDFAVGGTNVYVLDVDAGTRVQLTRNSWASFNPRWSRDGRLISFISNQSGQWKLWIMNADGSAARALGESCEPRAYHQTWSPDGKRIAFVCGEGAEGDVHIIGVDGTGERRLISAGRDNLPVWSPDGRRILIARMSGVNVDIYSLPVDGGEGLRITTDAGWETPFDWR